MEDSPVVGGSPRDALLRGRALDALVETRLTGAVGTNPPHYSSSHAASLALEQQLHARGWIRSYARGRDEPPTLVRLVDVDGRWVEAAGPDPIVNLCHAALRALAG